MSLRDQFETIPFDITHHAETIKDLCLRGCGIKRIDNFWTLGLATYKDGYNNLDLGLVENSNVFLKSMFPDLYRDQLEILSEVLQAPVKYMAGMPLPGFHVFKYCKEFEQPLARPHVDVPFNKYNWGGEVSGVKDIFTHVVPIEIPENAGMNVWDLTALDMHEQGEEYIVSKARFSYPVDVINYKLGEIIIHSGEIVHQIKPFDGPTDKWRITLQSHAVFKDGCWQLYW